MQRDREGQVQVEVIVAVADLGATSPRQRLTHEIERSPCAGRSPGRYLRRRTVEGELHRLVAGESAGSQMASHSAHWGISAIASAHTGRV